jgi:hypothetical protein
VTLAPPADAASLRRNSVERKFLRRTDRRPGRPRSAGLPGLDSWIPAPHRPLLHGAHRFRQELGTHSSVPAVCIFGYGFKTITGALVQRGAGGEIARSTFRFADAGDGMIPQHSAILPGAEIHPVRQQHGSLYADDDVRMRLRLELTRAADSVPA